MFITHTRGVTLAASTSVKPILDGGSFFYAAKLPHVLGCQAGLSCYELGFVPGDVVQVSQGSSLLTTTIPTLTALAYSNDDAIRGDAPASQSVSVLWSSGTNPDVSLTRIVTVSSGGAYAANTGHH
ncbi:MAG: hypothetical protein HC853_11790, partial [Anaerolineae bacterium]|nr:hypothetical protein [Anaerolineae bacterium]